MKKILFILCFGALVNNGLAHNQHVHQYLTIEAYNLLRLHLGFDIPILQGKLGGEHQVGLLVIDLGSVDILLPVLGEKMKKI